MGFGKQQGRYTAKLLLGCLLTPLALCLLTPEAQAQRALINTGFEANDPQGPGTPNWENFSDSAVPGWETTTGDIELWDSGFQSTPAHSGSVFAEMNANTPGAFYQNICIENNETVGWSFAHRARSGGPNPQIANFEIATTAGAVIQTLATQSTTIGSGWQVNSGTAAYSGTGGLVRVQFRTTNPGSYGNFLDTIEVDLAAYVEFNADTAYTEGSPNLPSMVVNGTVDATTTVPFTITGGTATNGTDYTVSAGFVTVPPGVYAATLFPLPITITNDYDLETLNETITFLIGTPSTTELKIADASCGVTAKTVLTHTIIDDDPEMNITKEVMAYDDNPGDGLDVFSIPGTDVIYTFSMSNSGNGPVDANSLFLVDTMPPEVMYYNGDIDDTGPFNPISFSQSDSGLTFTYPADVGFSKDTTAPADFAACSDTPDPGYDDSINYICFQPKGAFAAGDPDPTAQIQFRAQIK